MFSLGQIIITYTIMAFGIMIIFAIAARKIPEAQASGDDQVIGAFICILVGILWPLTILVIFLMAIIVNSKK